MQEETKNQVENSERKSSVFDYLRFGESYTSLVLGIVVVIIATILLLSFVHSRNGRKTNNTPQISDNAIKTLQTGTGTAIKTITDAVSPTPSPTQTPRAVIKNPQPTKTAKALVVTRTPSMVQHVQKVAKKLQVSKKENVHTVLEGDSLWTIAEKEYKSGYNWVDIARANNLSNSDLISVGSKLILPKIDQKNATSALGINSNSISGNGATNIGKIVGDKYVIKEGDNLWTIALRAYGDGYQWVKISRANNLSNPDLIDSGNSLIIPRK